MEPQTSRDVKTRINQESNAKVVDEGSYHWWRHMSIQRQKPEPKWKSPKASSSPDASGGNSTTDTTLYIGEKHKSNFQFWYFKQNSKKVETLIITYEGRDDDDYVES